MRTINKIIIHASATPASMDVSAADIDRWHKDRGWNGIGYHYVIRRDGTIEEGRPDSVVGAHCKGQNTYSLGICLIGGVDSKNGPEFNFTMTQMKKLTDLVDELTSRYKLTKRDVYGHNEFSTKSCPCFDVSSWFK